MVKHRNTETNEATQVRQTNVSVPERLFVRAKTVAIERRITFQKLVEEGLELRLAQLEESK